MTIKINVGDFVQESIFNLSGIIIATNERMNGNIQYCLQPHQPELNKPLIDATYIDAHSMTVVEEARVKPTAAVISDHINLGDTVQDIITGHKGVAHERMVYINGCVRYAVSIKEDNKAKDIFPDQHSLVLVKAAEKPPVKNPTVKGIVSGGPAVRVSHKSAPR